MSQLRQGRKVFVGGIPQDMNQDDLYTVFNEFAVVERAWLQRRGSDQDHFMNNHRGFGFVVFYNESAVNDLLGGSFSKFITLRDGKMLEVKRALVSTEMISGSWLTAGGTPQKLHQNQSQPSINWPKDQVHFSQTNWIGGPPGTWQSQMPPLQSLVPPPTPQLDGIESVLCAAVPQTLMPTYSSGVGVQFSGTPSAPLPLPAPACDVNSFVAMLTNRSQMKLGPEQPQIAGVNKKELEAALLQAMPDHYDD